jgi:DNA polymerase-3 subunit gamma/tau
MSFYRDYRPSRFADIIGQGEAIQIIKRQIVSGRNHHSYLLHGFSGSGKTSTARIIAMALNCENKNHDNNEPCGVCPSCEAVKNGRHWDVIEIDATRTRSIDDVKDLCYKAMFSPLGKFKVYIIDEAHQYGMPSWSAMLKIIEEPPPHVVFIFCTTDFKDIPETIASRCQCVEFGKVKPHDIKKKLERIFRFLPTMMLSRTVMPLKRATF